MRASRQIQINISYLKKYLPLVFGIKIARNIYFQTSIKIHIKIKFLSMHRKIEIKDSHESIRSSRRIIIASGGGGGGDAFKNVLVVQFPTPCSPPFWPARVARRVHQPL